MLIKHRRLLTWIIILVLLFVVIPVGSFIWWKYSLSQSLEKNSVLIQTGAGFVEYAETGRGRVVLLLHGGGTGFDQINFYRELAAQGFRVVCPTRPGYLRTPINTGKTFRTQANMLYEFLDRLGIREPVAVVANGLGGPLAINFAFYFPQRVSCIVFHDAVSQSYTPASIVDNSFATRLLLAGFRNDFFGWIQSLAVAAFPKLVFEQYLRAETNLRGEQCKQIAQVLMANKEEVQKLKKYVNMYAPMSKRLYGLKYEEALCANLPRYQLERLNIPTLVIHSRLNRTVPISHGEFLAATIPSAQYIAYDGLGSLSWFGGYRQAYTASLINFLKQNS